MLPWARRVLWGVVAVALVVFPLTPTPALRDLVQTLVTGAALGVAWWHLRQRRELIRLGWGMLVGAISLLGFSDAVAAFETHVVHHTGHPRPSNVLALTGYLLLGVGVVQFERHRSRGRQLPGGFEAAIFAFGALTPLLVFLIIPVVQDPGLTVASKTTTVAYALADLVVMTVIARLLVTDRRQALSLVFLSSALFVSLLADFWASLSSEGTATALVPVKMLWLAAFILFGAGVAHPSMREFTGGATCVEDTSSKRRVWLMGVGQALPALTLGIAWAVGGTPYSLVIALAGMVVSMLVAFRVTGLLDRINRQSARLAELARSDELTGLHNRRSWNHELSRARDRALERSEHLAIGLIDLDRFKAYNDTHGHLAGDRLLRDVACRWRGQLRPGDVLARYGGEEFAVILPGVDLAEAVETLDALRASTPDEQTVSAGVALWTPGSDLADVVARADAALYRAKRAGRNRVLAADDRDAASGLPAAADALRVVVQPIARADDLEVVGYEVLSRFPHSDDVASVFRQAHEQGYGDLVEALAVSRGLELSDRPGGVDLHVNVSGRAVRSPRFWDALPEDLTGVAVELHEDVPDNDVTGHLERLRGRGARIVLDDVGVRPTDLARVVALRPDVVKLDRSLVVGCEDREGGVAVLGMLVDFARSYGAVVCVEGVETAGALATVRTAGADLVQGYLLGRPAETWGGSAEPGDLRDAERDAASAPELELDLS